MAAYSAEIDRALAFAAAKHCEQRRKGSGVPYIAHPFMVSLMLSRAGLPDHVVIAGVLHDVVEDQDVSLEEIEKRFGSEVAALVADVTEQKTDGNGERPWRVRKQEALDHLEAASRHVAALKAADALHNCLSTIANHDEDGSAVWARFKAPRNDQLWYYGEVAKRVRGKLGDHPLAVELSEAVDRLRRCG